MMKHNTLAERLRALRLERGLSQKELCRIAHLGESAVKDIEADKVVSPRYGTVVALAAALQITPASLMGEDEPPRIQPYTPPPPKPEGVPEIDVHAGCGSGGECAVDYQPDGNGGLMATDRIKASWGLPDDYLSSELRINKKSARIIEIVGDSMSPTLQSGDRVMVNTADKNPSPPGVFALWDGFGVVVKRVERVHGSSPPAIRVVSDNANHREYILTAGEANIIGRVVWYARAL